MMIKTMANSYKGRDVFANEKVSVHRNLNADSLTIKVGSLVHGHAQMVALYNVTFSVGEKGNEKVNATNNKNVHAHVRGTIVKAEDVDNVQAMYDKLESLGYTRVYYNPYRVNTFVIYDTFEPIHECDQAIVIMDRVYIK
jgi:replication initiation and membrane attachment protein DnaB